MMFIVAGILGFLFGLFRGGRLQSVLYKRFRLLPLLFASLFFALLLASGHVADFLAATSAEGLWRTLLAFLQMAGMAVFAWSNRRKPGVLLIMLGGLLNSLVITLNQGRMPVGRYALRFGDTAVEQIARTPHYFLAEGGEALGFLADNIPLWTFGWYMVSIGDFLIAIGLFFLAAYLPRPLRRRRRPQTAATSRDSG